MTGAAVGPGGGGSGVSDEVGVEEGGIVIVANAAVGVVNAPGVGRAPHPALISTSIKTGKRNLLEITRSSLVDGVNMYRTIFINLPERAGIDIGCQFVKVEQAFGAIVPGTRPQEENGIFHGFRVVSPVKNII